ncbi:MAG: MFS transporter [Chloroflexi bacterium]|nr:MFS transporter [Chloroflexota bacterium]
MCVSTQTTDKNYKWIALSNTTLGVLMASMNSSIVLISLPAIFRGLGVNPLQPAESGYLLWMLLGYMVITATLLVTLGRLSDMLGRVRLYNLGFVIFTIGSIMLFLTPSSGDTGALEMIFSRLVQGVGGGFLIANSAAILTDAFPLNERGMALGLNMVAVLAGSLVGLIVGGLMSTLWWRAVFLVSVPIGIFGTVWAYHKLVEQVTTRKVGKIDILGNICLGGGLTIFLAAMTYGIMPYGSSSTGWGNPWVMVGIIAGLLLIALFVVVENRVKEPLFDMHLFTIRSFAMGCAAQLLSALAYGGFQFALIVWLQGIWLPLHGYNYEDTPLWSAIYLIPLLVGFMIFGVASGWLSDRIGPRGLSTGGMLGLTIGFILLTFFPANFSYPPFAVVLFIIGAAFGIFTSPNTAAIMNALPRQYRGVGSGMRSTFQGVGSPLSLTLFFSIIVAVLGSRLPLAIQSGLQQGGVPLAAAVQASHVPPTGALFASFLGYNPMQSLLSPTVIGQLSPAQQSNVLGTHFFPSIIGGPFTDALHMVFWFAAVLALLAALCSFLRGRRFVYEESQTQVAPASAEVQMIASGAVAVPAAGGYAPALNRQARQEE